MKYMLMCIAILVLFVPCHVYAKETNIADNPEEIKITSADDAPQYEGFSSTYTVAILPFSASSGDFKDLSKEIPLLLNTYISTTPTLILVERSEIEKSLGEIELGQSGTVDQQTAAKVGYMTGAQILVTGRVFPVQRDLMIVAKVIGVETGRTYGEVVQIPLQGDISEATKELSSKVAKIIERKGASLIAQEKKEDLVAELKPLLKDIKVLPTVSVHIEGQNMGLQGADTSAQTEILWVLENLGFTIIDAINGNKKADIEISGNSQSAFGLRKGNLVSVKANVEFKALHTVDNEVMHIDREQAVAVDLSPEMAGKQAQAKAAKLLMARFIKVLARK